MDKENYTPKIHTSIGVFILIIVVLTLLLSWHQYGFKKHFPETVDATLATDASLDMGDRIHIRKLSRGEQVTILAKEEGNHFWVETSDHMRGLLCLGDINNYQAIADRKDIKKYLLNTDNFININKTRMQKQYLGRTFEENETNHWPALYCYRRGNTTYATYLLRMWDGQNCYIPTVRYVNDTAVAITATEEAPIKGNKKWLQFTPWVEWLFSSPILHFHWDRPMIESEMAINGWWWWILLIPLILLLLIIVLLWMAVLFGPVLLLLIWLVSIRKPLMFLSNDALHAILMVVLFASGYFFMPYLLIGHGSFLTIVDLILIMSIWLGVIEGVVRDRCDRCRCLGFMKELRKEPDHTEYVLLTTTETVVVDGARFGYNPISKKLYYKYYCRCRVCGHDSERIKLEKETELHMFKDLEYDEAMRIIKSNKK